jgi:hypothetical protein
LLVPVVVRGEVEGRIDEMKLGAQELLEKEVD